MERKLKKLPAIVEILLVIRLHEHEKLHLSELYKYFHLKLKEEELYMQLLYVFTILHVTLKKNTSGCFSAYGRLLTVCFKL